MKDNNEIKLKLDIGDKSIIVTAPPTEKHTYLVWAKLALFYAQEAITSGRTIVYKRIFPCLFCDKDYENQALLIKHVNGQAHLKHTKTFRDVAKRLSKEKNV